MITEEEIKTLEILEKEALSKRNELNKIVESIDKIKSDTGLPLLNKKYLNKYFKTKNTYGVGGKPWYIYTVVESIQFPNSFKGKQFQTTSDGRREFEFEYNGYLSCLGKKITKEEYDKQLDFIKIFIIGNLK
jgi:hypothetical protein